MKSRGFRVEQAGVVPAGKPSACVKDIAAQLLAAARRGVRALPIVYEVLYIDEELEAKEHGTPVQYALERDWPRRMLLASFPGPAREIDAWEGAKIEPLTLQLPG